MSVGYFKCFDKILIIASILFGLLKLSLLDDDETRRYQDIVLSF